MKRSVLILIIVAFCTIFFETKNIYCLEKDNKTLKVVTSANNPPYEFVQYGNIVGFDIDLIKIICDRLDKHLELNNIPFSEVLTATKTHQCDMAIAEIDMCRNDEFGLDFSIPYLTNTRAVVMINSGRFKNVPLGAYFPDQLLQNNTIGVVSGSSVENELFELGIENLTIRRYENISKLCSEVAKTPKQQGILNGAVVNLEDAQMMVEQNKQLIFYRLKLRSSLAIAFPKNSPLRAKVNAVIADLINEGRIAELESKWELTGE